MATMKRRKSRPDLNVCTYEQKKEVVRGSRLPLVGWTTQWQVFYRTQTKRLSCIAFQMGVPPDQVEDVVQEVWLDAIKHHEGFEGESPEQRLASWLVIVVRNKSRDVIRRIQRQAESLDGQPVEAVDRQTKLPSEAYR